jgi:N-acetyl-anhydromuramoyl-L-alanine amidase
MSEVLKEIQTITGSVPDGIYGPNTAKAIISYLKVQSSASTLSYMTRNIQKAVGVWVDGVFGPKTIDAVLRTIKGAPSVVVPDIDTKYNEVYKETPNKSVRKIAPLGVVLHHSDGSYEGGVSWILNPDSNVSYHVLIDTNGDRTRFADDDRRAWHAGVSTFKGKRGCNDFLLGVSFSGNTNHRELTDAEVESAVEYILPRIKKYGWPTDLSTITTHRFVSPGRKDDTDVRAEERVMNALRSKLN